MRKNKKGRHFAKRSNVARTPLPAVVNSIKQQNLRMMDAEENQLYQTLSIALKNYTDKALCQQHVVCRTEIYEDLLKTVSMLTGQWMDLLKFWQRRVFFLDDFVDKFKVKEEGGVINPLESYRIYMHEEDRQRLNWDPVLNAIQDFIIQSQSPETAIDKLKINLFHCRESLRGDKAAQSFKRVLESTPFAKDEKIRPDSLFKYSVMRKVNKEIESFDRNMFGTIKACLFSKANHTESIKRKVTMSLVMAQEATTNLPSPEAPNNLLNHSSLWNHTDRVPRTRFQISQSPSLAPSVERGEANTTADALFIAGGMVGMVAVLSVIGVGVYKVYQRFFSPAVNTRSLEEPEERELDVVSVPSRCK